MVLVPLVLSALVLSALVLGRLFVGEAPMRLARREPPASWTIAVQAVDAALGTGNVSAATQAWADAYRAAMRAGRWEALVEVGDAYRRIGEVAGKSESFDAKAGEIYLLALSQARRQECVECLLRVAEAFAALGDREHVELSVRLAELLAAQDAEAQDDVRMFTTRFPGRLPALQR